MKTKETREILSTGRPRNLSKTLGYKTPYETKSSLSATGEVLLRFVEAFDKFGSKADHDKFSLVLSDARTAVHNDAMATHELSQNTALLERVQEMERILQEVNLLSGEIKHSHAANVIMAKTASFSPRHLATA